jgi:kumamolisin
MFGRSRRRVAKAALALSLGVGVFSGAARAETPAILAPATAAERVAFDVYFPLRDPAAVAALIEEQTREGSPQYRQWLTPAEFRARFGPTEATIDAISSELGGFGMAVTEHRGQQIRVSGSAAAVQAALGVALVHARFADGREALVADGAVRLPPVLAQAGGMIPQFTTVGSMRRHSEIVGNYNSATGAYFAGDLRQAYDFPSVTAVNARGVIIGILMSGDYYAPDIGDYLYYDGVPEALYPTLSSIPVNGGAPFSTANSAETHLDIEQSAGIALGAKIVLYDLSDLAVETALYGLNTIVDDNKVDIVNMSFGKPEIEFTAKYNKGIDNAYLVEIYDLLFAQGSAQGITFVASSGDHGAIPPAPVRATLSTETPASDPYVTAVGGTNLVTTHRAGSLTSAYVSENADRDRESGGKIWASGGGISIFWSKPSYQKLIDTGSAKARTVPDIALHMGGCPSDAIKPCGADRSSDLLVLGGQFSNAVGTSASSPDIAGLFALKVKLSKKRIGLQNPFIYQRAREQRNGTLIGAFHHARISGNNGKYGVRAPYDMVIGTGTIDARRFLGVTRLPPSGIRGSRSNP